MTGCGRDGSAELSLSPAHPYSVHFLLCCLPLVKCATELYAVYLPEIVALELVALSVAKDATTMFKRRALHNTTNPQPLRLQVLPTIWQHNGTCVSQTTFEYEHFSL